MDAIVARKLPQIGCFECPLSRRKFANGRTRFESDAESGNQQTAAFTERHQALRPPIVKVLLSKCPHLHLIQTRQDQTA